MILERAPVVISALACVLSLVVVAFSMFGDLWLYDAKAIVAVTWGIALLALVVCPEPKDRENG